MEMIYSVIPENTIFYVIIAVVFIYLRKYVSPPPIPIPTPISTTLDADIKELKRDMLALKNDHVRIEKDLEWRSEVRSRGPNILLKSKLSGLNLLPYLTREEKEKNVLPRKYIMLISIEINLSSATLASFYRHQKTPLKTSLDKIETWVEKENRKKIT
ncbi:3374_t:CDS:2 [Ambispora leptoticha]|uniref:3374_t:CDS:1 n=1 Tax=Ambispora leptoticha TaxID=144679 RepID=A0A9N9CEE8_9GLOM|nr:3374_t:CDS:2 [Ambispora leptoticha]